MEILEYIIGSILALYSLTSFLIGQITIIMWIDNYFNNKKNRRK